MTTKLSQRDRVRKYLLKHGSISNLYAIYTMHILRLGARIMELRDEGMDIETEVKKGRAVYRLVTE